MRKEDLALPKERNERVELKTGKKEEETGSLKKEIPLFFRMELGTLLRFKPSHASNTNQTQLCTSASTTRLYWHAL